MKRDKGSGRFILRVSSSEVSGPSGAGSRAEVESRNPRPPSGVRLNVPDEYRSPGRATTIVIDPPCDFINANDRLHHHAKAKLTKAWRIAAYEASMIPKRHLVGRAHVVVSIRFPTNHRRDVGNFYPTAKAILDGIVSRGRFLKDDDDTHVIGPDMRREYPNGPARVTVRIEELDS